MQIKANFKLTFIQFHSVIFALLHWLMMENFISVVLKMLKGKLCAALTIGGNSHPALNTQNLQNSLLQFTELVLKHLMEMPDCLTIQKLLVGKLTLS